MIQNQVPDKNGNVIPPTVSFGTYTIRDLNERATHTLFEGKLTIDKKFGHASYGCGNCCDPVGNHSLDPGTFDGLFGDYWQNIEWAYSSCTNMETDVTADVYGWTSSDSSIVTVDSYGMGNAVGAGSANLLGYLYTPGPTYKCPYHTIQPVSYPVNVKPTISGPASLWYFAGLSLGVSGYANQITLTANPSSGTIQWNLTNSTNGGGQVSLSSTTYASTTVTSSAQSKNRGDVSVTVTVNGQTSTPFTLTVLAPYAAASDPLHTSPVYLSDSTYVWQTDIYYSVVDNFLTPLPANLNVNEHWTTNVVNDQPNTWRQPTANGPGCGSTVGNVELEDTIFGETTDKTPTPVYNTQMNGAAVYHWGQEWRVGTCTEGSGPRIMSDTLQKYVDHAAYTGVTTPNP